jgi:hypothetical protein
MSGSASNASSSIDVDMTSTLSPTERDAALTKLSGQCALIETLLSDNGKSNIPPGPYELLSGLAKSEQKEIDDALQAFQWDVFGLAVGDLGNTKTESEQFAKAYRMHARTRTLVVKLHNSVDESARGPSRTFLLEGASAVEQALTRTTLVSWVYCD